MKIRCKECKTIYDDSEKYCPYCFTRTKRKQPPVSRIKKQRAQHNVTAKDPKQKKYQKKQRMKNQKQWERRNHDAHKAKVIMVLFVLFFFLLGIFFSSVCSLVFL